MITGTSEELEEMVQNSACPEHGPKLCVAWHAGEKAYVVRCSEGHFPEEVTKQLTPTQEFKQGKREPVGVGLNLLPKADLATGELLNPDMVHALISYAEKYGLDPYRSHVYIMYSKPYIGLDGYLYHANKEKIPYQLRSRPLNEEERKTYHIGESDHAWTCEVVLPLTNQSFTGLGIVTMDEITAKSKKVPTQLRSPVVAAHPRQLAQKRAEWQAMRRAFPIGETDANNM